MDIYWSEAEKCWVLPRLYTDLGEIKGRKLTDLQRAILRGLLCGVSIKDVAKQLGRKINGLRTDVSTTLYRYIDALLYEKGIQQDGKIYWQQIPRLLTLAGYAQKSPSEIQVGLQTISSPSQGIEASEIIEAVDKQRLNYQHLNLRSSWPVQVAKDLDQQGDSAWYRQDYLSALHFYFMLVENNPRANRSSLVKIAMCFEQLEQYDSAVDISLWALTFVSNQDQSAKYNGVLGTAFYELALNTLDDLVLWQALDYYKKASVRSGGPYVLGTWNSFDLLVKFSALKADGAERYLRTAQLCFHEFQSLASEPQSDFKHHKEKILKDAERIQSDLKDEWLCKELSKLRDI